MNNMLDVDCRGPERAETFDEESAHEDSVAYTWGHMWDLLSFFC